MFPLAVVTQMGVAFIVACAVAGVLALLVVAKFIHDRNRIRKELQEGSRTLAENGLGEFTGLIDAASRHDVEDVVRETKALIRLLGNKKELVAKLDKFWKDLTHHKLADQASRQATIDEFNREVNATGPAPAAASAPAYTKAAAAATAPPPVGVSVPAGASS